MLTAAQVRTAAYSTPWGELYCPECTTDRLETDGGAGVEGFEPMIQYSLDEYAGERAANLLEDEGPPEGCTTECEPFGIECDSCGTELVEAYHYGHEDDENITEPVS